MRKTAAWEGLLKLQSLPIDNRQRNVLRIRFLQTLER
jgi:hypothetical protein